MIRGYLGIDQYGQYYQLKKHPRKELLEQLYASKAEKMYIDNAEGETKHVGYIIKGAWITVLEVHDWNNTKG